MGTVAVGVLVGCRSAPERVPQVTELPAPAPVTPAITNRITPPPSPTGPPTPATPTPNVAADQWIAWDRWCAANGLGQPQRKSLTVNPPYALRTSHGTLTLTPGSRLAFWDGLEFWLGFAPQLIDHHPFVNGLDVQKNLQPLLSDTNQLAAAHRVIVIDPGHGGENSGARSILGDHFEKEYTLDWARRLEALLTTNGWKAVLTRTNDTDLALSNRVALAEQVKPDLFLSLHFNSAFPNQKKSGVETYCLTPTGLPSSLVRDFADDPRQVFPNNAFDEPNLQWAAHLQRALVAATAEPDRGVQRARFMGVLRGQNRPAVLIEGGYLSNPHDARLIASPEHRQKLAEAVARVLNENNDSKVASTQPAGSDAAGPP